MTTHKMKRIKGKMTMLCKQDKLYDYKENLVYHWVCKSNKARSVDCKKCLKLGGK